MSEMTTVGRPTRSGTRPRPAHRAALFVLGSLLVIGGLALAAPGPDAAAADEPWVSSGWSGGELPNVSIVLRSISSADEEIEGEVLPSLREVGGVESAFADVLPGGPPVLHLVLSDPGQLDLVTARVAELSGQLGGNGELLVGGQLVADVELEQSVRSNLIVVTIGVVLLIGLVCAALYGLLVGLGTALSLGLATLLGGFMGSSLAGSFDGTIGSTAIPGALAGLLVGATLCFRLISWFKHPLALDNTDNILASIKAQLPDLVVAVGTLGAVAAVTGLVHDGWSASVTVFVGALFGALAVLATMPALLSTLSSVPDNSEFGSLPVKVPDGRDLPVAVVIAVSALLLVFGFSAAGGTPSTALIDARSDQTSVAAQIASQMVDLGGDPASAIRATAPDAGADWFMDWAADASRYPGVGWVATSDGRFEDGTLIPSPEGAAAVGRGVAIINPTESARSAETQATVRALAALEAPETVGLEGLPVVAAKAAEGAERTLWVVVGTLALIAGALVLFLVGDLGLAVVAVALRVLTVSASLGAYSLVVDAATASELLVVALLLSTGVSLFETGLIRMILNDEEPQAQPTPEDEADGTALLGTVSRAMRSGGGHAVAALGVVALAGVGLGTSGLGLVAAFGLALAVAIAMEVLLGIWLLRPVIIGEQAFRAHAPAIGGRSIIGRRGPSEGEPVNPEWRRVVSGLLREEFRFQTEPDEADLGTVFVEGTPLFGELAQHNLRLRENGLRIRGEGPTVVSVKAVNDGDPVTVAITVDHPSRQLLSVSGKLLGVRAAERRDGMLWLSQDPSGRYRISEAVDMGSGVPIPSEAKDVQPAPAK